MTKLETIVNLNKKLPDSVKKVNTDIDNLTELIRDRINHSSFGYLGLCPAISKTDYRPCIIITEVDGTAHYYLLSDVIPLLSETRKIKAETIMKKLKELD